MILYPFSETNTLLGQVIHASIVVVAFFLLLYYLRAKLSKYFDKLLKKGEKLIYKLISDNILKTTFLFIAALSLFLGAMFLDLPPTISFLIQRAMIIVLMVQVGLWGNEFISYFVESWRVKYYQDAPIAKTSAYLINFSLKTILWIIVIILLLENLNFEVKTMIAGVGLGSITVALAAQNILGDIMSSFSIFFDQPFVIGDNVSIDGYQGQIEHIGIKSTRMRSVDGEIVVLNNSDLLRSRLRNFKLMEERRVVFLVNIPFETELRRLVKVPTLLKEIVSSFSKVRLDRVHFKEVGTYSHQFEIVYYVLSREHKDYMDLQQEINYQILKAFSKEGISLAYPTEKVLRTAGKA